MDAHGYGYGVGQAGEGGQDVSGAGSRAAPRPQGWSSVTRLLRNPSPPPRDPFPPLATAATASRANAAPLATINSGERSQNGGNGGNGTNNNEQQQLQTGVSNSPTSSAGSFSSNYSGRNHSWGHQADAQAAFSSNAAASGGDQQGVLAGGSPPESSSGSFAPNLSHVNHTAEDFRRRHHQPGAAGPASSAGSFSFNRYPYAVQPGACDTRLGGGQSVLNGTGMEREASGGAKREAQVGLQGDQVNGYKSALKRREFHSRQVTIVAEGRRDETSDADRIALDNARPVVSDGRSSIGDADRDFIGGHEHPGKDACDSTAASFAVPIEPEWEEEDMYHSFRSDALRESRARDKFVRGASQAYVNGDHRKAKALSRQAEEKRFIVDKLHAEAASKIFDQRNKGGPADMWHLDLHGLHASEAVAALEKRLALLEHGVTEYQEAGLFCLSRQLETGGQRHGVGVEHLTVPNSEGHGINHEDKNHQLFQSLIPAARLLSVITGIGAHSQDGPSLPSAVKTFLINNGYQLEEPRPGVISVRPKLRYFL